MLEQKIFSKERLIYLDLIKTIAIYFVCFYHFNKLNINFLKSPSLSTYLNYLIYGIGSPAISLFFMVNGAIMLNKSFDLKKHIKKIITIIILTIIWGVVTLLILAPITGDSYTIKQFILALWVWKQFRINHLWFLQALVCLYILFPLIKTIYDKEDKKILYYFLIITFILTFGNVFLNNIVHFSDAILNVNHLEGTINYFNNFNVFNGFSTAFSIVYFIIGGLLISAVTNKKIKISNLLLIAVLVLGTAISYFNGILISRASNTIYDYGFNGINTTTTLLMASAVFILTSQYKGNHSFLTKIIRIVGANTLGIYLIHIIAGFFLTPYYSLLPFSSSTPANLIYGAVLMFISLFIVLILKKIPVLRLLVRI